MRSKFVEHPVKPFAINLRAQVLIRTNPRKLGLVTAAWIAAIIVRQDLPHRDNVTPRVQHQASLAGARTTTCLDTFGSYVALRGKLCYHYFFA